MKPDYSKILNKGYQQFILDIEGKKVAVPYRINIPPIEHTARQGKSSPGVLLQQLHEDAANEGFNLKNATGDEIWQFMVEHKLGIDCSGFTYRMLDFLVEELGFGKLTENDFEHVGRTNVSMLTSETHAVSVASFKDAQPGDIIRLDSGDDVIHCVLIIEKRGEDILYAHSSGITKIKGVHMDTIINGEFSEDLNVFKFNPEAGDGIFRLKVLN